MRARGARVLAASLLLCACAQSARGGSSPDAPLGGTLLVGGAGGVASASARVLARGPLSLRVLAASEFGPSRGDTRPVRVLAGERLELGGPRSSLWLGLRQQQAWSPIISAVPSVTAGGWARAHGFLVTTDVQRSSAYVPRPPVYVYTYPPTLQGLEGDWPPQMEEISNTLPFWWPVPPKLVHLTLVETTVSWSRGRLDLEAGGGMVTGPGIEPRRLARAEAAWWLRPQLALTVAVIGRMPAWLGVDLVSPGHLQLGLRVEPRRPGVRPAGRSETGRAQDWEWRAGDAGAGRIALALRAPAARSVDLRGDLTAWNPIALEPVGDGWWRIVLPIAPGVHEIEIRVDGGRWLPPPGVPTKAGAYGGCVGILVTT